MSSAVTTFRGNVIVVPFFRVGAATPDLEAIIRVANNGGRK